MQLKINCDGGARGNPGPAAIGFVIKSTTGKVIHKHGQYIGPATNNVAEYHAVIAALSWLIKNKKLSLSPAACHFFLDSVLVVNQLNGLFKVKDSTLRNLIVKVKILEQQFSIPITYTAIPREQNSQADFLVNQALDERFSKP